MRSERACNRPRPTKVRCSSAPFCSSAKRLALRTAQRRWVRGQASVRRAAGALQETTCSRHHPAGTIQRTTCSGQRAADTMNGTTCNRQRAADEGQHTACSRSIAVTGDMQPTTMQQTADDNAHDNAKQQSIHDSVLSVEAQPMAAERTTYRLYTTGTAPHPPSWLPPAPAPVPATAPAPYHSVSSCMRVCVCAHARARA